MLVLDRESWYTGDMYFKSRAAAGEVLAEQIAKKYRHTPCAVVALNDGAVVVAAQIALKLRCVLTMLLTDSIQLPREDTAIAGISQDGSFTYNNLYSPGEIDEFVSEYHGFIEQEKMNKLQQMHKLEGPSGLIRRELLRNRTVILVSDGLMSGFSLDLAVEYTKTIQTNRIVVATPMASVKAVDRMHILADEIYCLSVSEDFISTDHYYEVQDVPSHDDVVKTVEEVVRHWK